MKKGNSPSQQTRRTYNQLAKLYHEIRTNPKTGGWFYNEYLEMPTTLKMLGKVRGKRILDLGCGTGLYARILLQKGAKVKGIDVSDEMLRIAQQEVPSVEFTQGSAERLPYKKNEFDIVLAALMMEYLPSWNRVLKEVHRVL